MQLVEPGAEAEPLPVAAYLAFHTGGIGVHEDRHRIVVGHGLVGEDHPGASVRGGRHVDAEDVAVGVAGAGRGDLLGQRCLIS